MKLHGLEQKDGELIADYLSWAEDLVIHLLTNDINIGMFILKGMREGDKRKRISFECNKDSDYLFKKIKLLIKAAYSEISKLSPFDPDYKELMQVLLLMKGAMSNDELL